MIFMAMMTWAYFVAGYNVFVSEPTRWLKLWLTYVPFGFFNLVFWLAFGKLDMSKLGAVVVISCYVVSGAIGLVIGRWKQKRGKANALLSYFWIP